MGEGTRARFTAGEKGVQTSDAEAAPTLAAPEEELTASASYSAPSRPLIRYPILVAAFVVIAVVISLAAASTRESVHAARAEVFFPLNSDRAVGFLREDRRLATQVSIIDSRELLGPIAEANGLPLDDLEDKVHPSIVGTTEVVRIEVQDPDEAVALDLTRQVLDAYLSAARSVNVDPAEALIEAELARVELRLAEINTALAAPAELAPPQQAVLLAENRALLDELSNLRAQLVNARSRSAVEEPSAIAQPHVLDGVVSPQTSQAVAAGILVGLLVSGVWIFYVERRRRTASFVVAQPA